MKLTELKPEGIFRYFDEVCKVPRPSGKEEQIIAYLKAFGQEHGLKTVVDKVGNVSMEKPATPGYENRKKVILQCHEDMVCEKNGDVKHDFLTDPIEPYVDGDWLRAKGTTLGADNGIGIATCLAILADDSLEHGPIQCVFTRDEESGMTGAFGMEAGFMDGEILINLDSEDEGEMFIGCAGGANTEASYPVQTVGLPQNRYFFRVAVKGLCGGHSGDDINKGRANANKLLARFLHEVAGDTELQLVCIDGGNLHNAIPREAHALACVPMDYKETLRMKLNIFTAEVSDEFSATEKDLATELETVDSVETGMTAHDSYRIISTLHAMFNGVYEMSMDMPGLVQTSSNLASVKTESDRVKVVTSQRSAVESQRRDVSDVVSTIFKLGGFEPVTADGYPGWKPNPESEILGVTVESYERLFGKKPIVRAIHAGLECGLFLEKYPHLDMVSFGPTMRGVHSPDERMLIPTVEMYWKHLLDVLQHIPTKE